MSRLVIIGASGHGKVVADIAALNAYTNIIFADDNKDIRICAGYTVVADSRHAPEGDLFVAIGNARFRKDLMRLYRNRALPVLIHPTAVIARNVEIGEGSVVMAGAVINPGVRIGKGCIINTSSSIDHDCVIKDYVHISVGANLSGTVTVGEGAWIGAGATISNNVDICPNVTIGAGAVVIKDIGESGTYIGVPAKKMFKYNTSR